MTFAHTNQIRKPYAPQLVCRTFKVLWSTSAPINTHSNWLQQRTAVTSDQLLYLSIYRLVFWIRLQSNCLLTTSLKRLWPLMTTEEGCHGHWTFIVVIDWREEKMNGKKVLRSVETFHSNLHHLEIKMIMLYDGIACRRPKPIAAYIL